MENHVHRSRGRISGWFSGPVECRLIVHASAAIRWFVLYRLWAHDVHFAHAIQNYIARMNPTIRNLSELS